MTTVETITAGVFGFFVLLAVVAVLRLVLRREVAVWRELRVGFFIERDRDDPPAGDV